MKVELLQMLLTCAFLSGLCVVTSSAFRAYHPVHEGKTWSEAQSHCREHYQDLVSIDSMEEYHEIRAVLEKTTHTYWTGLYRDRRQQLHWSLAVPGAYRPYQTGYSLADAGGDDDAHCGLHLNKWIWRACSAEKPFICYDDKERPAHYVAITKKLNWTDAQGYCRDHHTDLASGRNKAEDEAIRSAWKAAGASGAWIGLFRDDWRWSDGSKSSFRWWSREVGWANPAGKKHAAMRAADGKMTNDDNKDELYFVCYSDNPDVPRISTESPILPTSGTDSLIVSPFPKRKQVLRLKVTLGGATVDLNDPAVSEDLLKQMKDKLKQNGVSGDLKLTWKKQPDGKIFKKTEL